MAMIVKTCPLLSVESPSSDCTSGTTNIKPTEIIKPNIPTDRNGKGNPPRL